MTVVHLLVQMMRVFGERGHTNPDVTEPACEPGKLEETTLLRAAQFLHHELPIRFAHRVLELQSLPHGLGETPSVRKVCEWYRTSFQEIKSTPVPHDKYSEAAFTRLLEDIYLRHMPTLVTMARGVLEFRRHLGVGPGDTLPGGIEGVISSFLDNFYSSRIGIRTLIEQQIALHKPRPGYVGIINTHMRPVVVAEDAVANARLMVERQFGEAPDVVVHGDREFSFSYIPSHLHHIIFELVKNSMRAVVETHGEGTSSSSPVMPAVKVIIAGHDDQEDVSIKVADEGGGIPRSGMNKVWSYFYTTYATPTDLLDRDADDFSTQTPLAGLGYGLPLSRLYARYFGGDLQLISMEGYGTDAFLHLQRVGTADERIQDSDEVIGMFPNARGPGPSEEGSFDMQKPTKLRRKSVSDVLQEK